MSWTRRGSAFAQRRPLATQLEATERATVMGKMMMEGLGHGDGGQWGRGASRGERRGRGSHGARSHKVTNTQLRKPPTMLDGEGRGPHPRAPSQSSQGVSSPRDSTHKISVLRVCGSHVCMGEGAGAGAPQAQGWGTGHATARGDTPTLCMGTPQTGAPRPNPHRDSSATATHVLGTARYHACV